mmetsp:Transcript_27940/g.75284  ORF Transcript_27940/g.75284 Transcript_27940/m.75284 type:complete len:234 (-) Transcript_27940:411-1112(-)
MYSSPGAAPVLANASCCFPGPCALGRALSVSCPTAGAPSSPGARAFATLAARALSCGALTVLTWQLRHPQDEHRRWFEAIAPHATEADVFTCANTITDIYELILRRPSGTPAESEGTGPAGGGNKLFNTDLSDTDLQRIREATGGTPRPHEADAAPGEAEPRAEDGEGATKRPRDVSATEEGAREKHARLTPPTNAGAPASTTGEEGAPTKASPLPGHAAAGGANGTTNGGDA